MTDLVHIRIGTLGSNYYITACGLNSHDLYVTSYGSKHLVSCKECLQVFAKSDKPRS